jgi:large subunit ribosomal protein L18
MTTKSRNDMRKRRHARVRRKIEGTTDRPRLNVFRSLSHIYAQLIDDAKGETLAAASTLDSDLRGKLKGKSKTEQAKLVGELIAARGTKRGVKIVLFDRGGYRYHGRVKALAEGAREGGLEF